MIVRSVFFSVCVFFLNHASANVRNEIYFGTAKNKSGNIVYTEEHHVSFSEQGNVLKAITYYKKPGGDIFGELTSDFSKNLTAPEYSFVDKRVNSRHGIRSDTDKIVIWKQDNDTKIKERTYLKSEVPSNVLFVGCQGLHYYVIQNFDTIKEKKEIPLKYLIPGKLDDYQFTLRYSGEDKDHIFLSVQINNVLLRLFVSSLELKYRKSDKRLLAYNGLSNIPSDEGKIQTVNIDYSYPAGGANEP